MTASSNTNGQLQVHFSIKQCRVVDPQPGFVADEMSTACLSYLGPYSHLKTPLLPSYSRADPLHHAFLGFWRQDVGISSCFSLTWEFVTAGQRPAGEYLQTMLFSCTSHSSNVQEIQESFSYSHLTEGCSPTKMNTALPALCQGQGDISPL